jgi:hypothetical protein
MALRKISSSTKVTDEQRRLSKEQVELKKREAELNKLLDYELELGFLVAQGNELGHPISISEAARPALSRARLAASMARPEIVPSGWSRCRELIPVRFEIHSSDVSTTDSRSRLVARVAGARHGVGGRGRAVRRADAARRRRRARRRARRRSRLRSRDNPP